MLEANIAASEVSKEGLRVWSTAIDSLGGSDGRWSLLYAIIA